MSRPGIYYTLLHIAKVEYLHENGMTGHIKDVNYWYRRIYNNRRGKSAAQRVKEMAPAPPEGSKGGG